MGEQGVAPRQETEVAGTTAQPGGLETAGQTERRKMGGLVGRLRGNH